MQQFSIKEMFPLNDKRITKQEQDEIPSNHYKLKFIYQSEFENLVFDEKQFKIVSIWGDSNLERGSIFFKAGTQIENVFDLYQNIGIKKEPYENVTRIMQVKINKNTPLKIMLRVIHDVRGRVPFFVDFLGKKWEGMEYMKGSCNVVINIESNIDKNSHDFIHFKLGSSFFTIPVFFKMQD